MMILEFTLKGDMALWAKSGSNFEKISSDLPPRSAITGMIGRICGMFNKKEVDAFFYDENCKIAVSPIHFGHLMVSAQNDIHEDTFKNYRAKKSKQRPIGQLIPDYHLGHNKILYKIYIYHKDQDFLQGLYEKILYKQYADYRPYLGASDYMGTLIDAMLHENYQNEEMVDCVHSIVKNQYMKKESPNTEYMMECLQRYTNEHYYAEELTYYYYTENTDKKPVVGTFEGEFIKLGNGKIISWM